MNLHVKYVERKCRIKDGLKLQKSIKLDNDGKDEEDFDDKDKFKQRLQSIIKKIY